MGSGRWKGGVVRGGRQRGRRNMKTGKGGIFRHDEKIERDVPRISRRRVTTQHGLSTTTRKAAYLKSIAAESRDDE